MSSTAPRMTYELRDVFASERLSAYLRELWERRHYIAYVARSDLRTRQINNVLGNLWHILTPALTIATYYVIFGLVLKVDRGVDNFILFLTVGIFIFQYTQRSTMAGANSVVGNVGIIRSIKFPRALLPITSSITAALTAASSLLIIYCVAVLTSEPFRWQWALLGLLGVWQLVFNAGAALVAARLATHFRDVVQFLPFFFRLLLYGSGVIFSVDRFVGPSYQWIFELNPMYCFVSMGRWCVLGDDVDPVILVSAATWTVGLLVVGFLWFRAGEGNYARD